MPLAEVAAQGLGEEARELFAQVRIETDAIDLCLVFNGFRSGVAVAVTWRAADRHLVEGDRRGVAFCVQIPAAVRAQRQKGIEVGRRPRLDVLWWRATEREIEQDEAKAARMRLGNADILWLDVAMADALLLELHQGSEQFLAVALQHVQRQATFLLEALGEGGVAGTSELEGGPASNAQRLAVLDDVGVAKLGQHFAFATQRLVMRNIVRNL